LTPESVTVPAVVFCSAPVPASAALTLPDCRPKMPDDDSVPFWMVPPPCSVTPPFWVCGVPPRSRIAVAPFTVVALPVLPSVPAPEICKVPALTMVPPE
jgi:hypothetical protein